MNNNNHGEMIKKIKTLADTTSRRKQINLATFSPPRQQETRYNKTMANLSEVQDATKPIIKVMSMNHYAHNQQENLYRQRRYGLNTQRQMRVKDSQLDDQGSRTLINLLKKFSVSTDEGQGESVQNSNKNYQSQSLPKNICNSSRKLQVMEQKEKPIVWTAPNEFDQKQFRFNQIYNSQQKKLAEYNLMHAYLQQDKSINSNFDSRSMTIQPKANINKDNLFQDSLMKIRDSQH